MTRLRINEGGDALPIQLWDSVWNPLEGQADWALAEPDESQNRGGLRAKAALHTAVTLALFTDLRCPDDHPLAYLADGDRRGWWGDGVDIRSDLGETPLGSLLWLLERAPLTSEIVQRWAPTLVQDALAPLLAQGAVTRMEIGTAANELRSRLEITVRLYGRDGSRIYDERFAVIWNQLR
jgi:phage gp46-like protein